ncbi:restriction endonuclease [Pseudomonas sp. MH10]|uniref:restriction endonuclease n=1 Tax=Pseudomonas sp. MH10 TaxID=3048627 RepID=UPI002AC95788|nr:restriction endonuclease [Pseudomonas sp. MH10]WPX66569.1 restriction endonuclease [Pseudomonas sp. MH10]
MVIAALVIGQGDPGDAGIDGIMSIDKLGLGKFYVQSKRWRIMRWSRHHNCCDYLHWIVITLTKSETCIFWRTGESHIAFADPNSGTIQSQGMFYQPLLNEGCR